MNTSHVSARILTHLIIVRRGHEDDRTFARDVERAARPDLTEEDVGDYPPEDKRGIVDEVGVLFAMYNGRHEGRAGRGRVVNR